MKIKQYALSPNNIKSAESSEKANGFVLIFGGIDTLKNDFLNKRPDVDFGGRDVISVSASGEFYNGGIIADNEMLINDVILEKSQVKCKSYILEEFNNSFDMGKAIYNSLDKDGLQFLWIFSDGQVINGEELLNGFDEDNIEKYRVMGGMAGDGGKFEDSIVCLNGEGGEGYVVVMAFYGEYIRAQSAYQGGWCQFGPLKKVTKSDKNTVYEINGKPALEVYKRYLGDEAQQLPASALLYPLSIIDDDMNDVVTRTILSINNEDNSMVFAGNINENKDVKMMRASIDDLISAASSVSDEIPEDEKVDGEHFILAVSCVGRRLVYNERMDEELMAVKSGREKSQIAGYFSNGEFSPDKSGKNLLHNQTLTLADIYEV